LSRDAAEVDMDVADPLCGFALSPETMPALFGSSGRLADPEVLSRIRKDLPVLLVSGDREAGSWWRPSLSATATPGLPR
jgi:alpha-beta hydrolase superfamily lysophospholipase